MKLKTLTFIVLASVAALTGCEDKTSVDWYMAHHDDMLAKYRECIFNPNFVPTDCQNARSEGYKQILKDLDKARVQEPIADLN